MISQSALPVSVSIKKNPDLPHLHMLVVDKDHLLTIPTDSHMYALLREWNGLTIDSEVQTQDPTQGQTQGHRILSYGFPVTDVDTTTQRMWLAQLPASQWQSCQTTMIPDGSIIKIVWYRDAWLVSTEKYVTAHDRRWIGSKSLGQLFEEVWSRDDMNALLASVPRATEYTHVFTLIHPENRHVVPYQHGTLIYMGSRHMSTFHVDVLDSIQSKWMTLPPLPLQSLSEVTSWIQKQSTWLFPGIRLYFPESDRLLQIQNPHFHHVADLKGNTIYMIQHIIQYVLWGYTLMPEILGISSTDGKPGDHLALIEFGLRRGVNLLDTGHVSSNEPSETHVLSFMLYYPEYIPLIQQLYRFVDRLYLYLHQDHVFHGYQTWKSNARALKLNAPWYHLLKGDIYVHTTGPNRHRGNGRHSRRYGDGHGSHDGSHGPAVLPPIYWNSKQIYEVWKYEVERALWIPSNLWSVEVAAWNQGKSIPAIHEQASEGHTWAFPSLSFIDCVQWVPPYLTS